MMKVTRLISMVGLAGACAVGVLPAASASAATSVEVSQASSGNWSGYVVQPSSSGSGSFRSVSGSWVQPTASCSGGQSYSAFWVGLGGAGQREALEQAGTEANCSGSGTPSYYGWYELVPSAPVKVNMTVAPGDRMSSTVTVNGEQVTVSLTDHTSGASFAKTLTMSDPDTSSAEWIAEAPSACGGSMGGCTPLSLADFGSVRFTGASATTTGGVTGTISDFPAAAVTLSPSASGMGFAGYGGADVAGGPGADGGSGGAAPSGLSSDGSSFSVSYSSGASSSSSAGAGGSGGYGYPGDGAGYLGGYGGGYPGGWDGSGGWGYSGGWDGGWD